MKQPKPTTATERQTAEETMRRMIVEMEMQYLSISIDDDGSGLYLDWGNGHDSIEGTHGETLDAAYLTARFEIDGQGQTPPPF